MLATNKKNARSFRAEAEKCKDKVWLVGKIMVPFWVPIMIRPLIFRVPKKGLLGYI